MKVKLNPTAGIYFDPVTRIKVLPGEVVELTEAQSKYRAIQSSLHNGYLVEVKGEVEATVVNKPEVDLSALTSKFKELVNEGAEPSDIKDKFNTKELIALAESFDILAEEGDTKLDLVTAIIEEIK